MTNHKSKITFKFSNAKKMTRAVPLSLNLEFGIYLLFDICNLKFKRLSMATVLSPLLLLAFIALPQIASADGGFVCTPGQGAFACFNRIYAIALVVGAVGAVFMIAVAGYLYMFSGGSERNAGKAKELIIAAISGLVILLAGFLVLRQINPDLLRFRSISPEQIARQDWFMPDGTVVTTNNGKPPQGATPAVPGQDIKNCPSGIQPIPADIAGRAGERACTTLIDALRELKNQAQQRGIGMIVTDAFGPNHDSICHRISGTCADVVPVPSTADAWNKLCAAVKATGKFRLVNEYKSGTAPECGEFFLSRKRSGDHLHIILQSAQDDLN